MLEMDRVGSGRSSRARKPDLLMQDTRRGKELASFVLARMKRHAALISGTLGRNPTVAIIASDETESRKFVELKREALTGYRFDILPTFLQTNCNTSDAASFVDQLNARPDVDAIFLQFPLPVGVDVDTVRNRISIAKDIDCSSDVAEAQFADGTGYFTPIAAAAAYDLLVDELLSVNNWVSVIVGREDAFVRALALMLQRKGAAVAVVGAEDAGAAEIMSDADAVIVANDTPDVQLLDSIEWVAVLLDAGYCIAPRSGAWLSARTQSRIGVHLTQYGNVGPLTVAHLARATVRAAYRHMNSGNQRFAAPAVTKYEQSVDDALDGSFPASDSPPWTLGSTRDALRLPEHSHMPASAE